ncbi:9713_t:CDS:2, partial [Ambispora leptoticha]
IRGCVNWIHSSGHRQQIFEDYVTRFGGELVSSQRPTLNMVTRWNSTYKMLESTILYQSIFDRLVGRDNSFEPIAPFEEDWKKAENLCKFLKPFYETINLLSGSAYSTANLFLPPLINIKMHLERN